MRISGVVRIDRKTKDLVKRMHPGEIALILHKDLDHVAAESLLTCKIKAVINCYSSISGKYVNRAPLTLISAGIPIIDDVGENILQHCEEGNKIEIDGQDILRNNIKIASGIILTPAAVNLLCEAAKVNLENEIDKFVDNTLSYLKKEKHLLHDELKTKELNINLRGQQVLVVVRGPEYKKDLEMLKQYIREKHPIIIAVDGGADTLLENDYKPNIILGDMDSVNDKTLQCGATIIVHAYEDGKAPGLARIQALGLPYHVISSIGTSEDLALLLSYEKGAEIIVIVGSHFSMEEFLSKGRKGMASTFLTRLKVGSILVDAKGVSKLYEHRVKPIFFFYILAAALFPIFAIIWISPTARQFIRLLRMLLHTVF